jgi:5-methylcytosine-specific restriction endonuclease McrA
VEGCKVTVDVEMCERCGRPKVSEKKSYKGRKVCGYCISSFQNIGKHTRNLPVPKRLDVFKYMNNVVENCKAKSIICCDCGFILPLDEFYFQRDKKRIDGFRHVCKKCRGVGFQTVHLKYSKEDHLMVKNKCRHGPVSFSTYSEKLKYAEKVYCGENGLLLVRCKYCDRRFNPKRLSVESRIRSLMGQIQGENSFYCSEGCKRSCPTFNTRTKERTYKKNSSREANPELRKIVLKRDGYKCTKCGAKSKKTILHCHHVMPAKSDPMLANDPDNCITVCKQCHQNIHGSDGCKYSDLRGCASHDAYL